MTKFLANNPECKHTAPLVSMALVDIREMLWRHGNNAIKAAGSLADVFHNFPMEIHGYGHWDLLRFRNQLVEHQNKYGGRNYVAFFDEIFNKNGHNSD